MKGLTKDDPILMRSFDFWILRHWIQDLDKVYHSKNTPEEKADFKRMAEKKVREKFPDVFRGAYIKQSYHP